jgi:hypothetical protein
MPNTNPVVNEDVTDPEFETPVDETELDPTDDTELEDPVDPVPAPGDKTPPNLLLKSLQEERAKVKDLEEQILLLTSSTPPPEGAFSDEGKALEARINQLNGELAGLKEAQAKKDLLATYPVLKDKWDEFESFRALSENNGMSMQAAAKVYLTENGMFTPRRKGVEKPTGGGRTPAPSGMMTAEDAANLRQNDSRKYRQMLKDGQIKIAPSS